MRFSVFLLMLGITIPAVAQDALPDPQTDAPQPVTVQSVNPVDVGQRENSEQVAQQAGIKLATRVNGRIENRIQSRINSRLERNYRPSSNATASFVGAGERVRRAGATSRR